MTAKEILEKAKLMFNELVAAPSGEPAALAAPVTAVLKDGTEVMIDKLEPGGIVMIGETPAPAGIHELQDGTKLTVIDNGVIEAIETPIAVDPAPLVDEMGAKFSAFEGTVNQKFAAYDTAIAGYEQRFADQEAKITKASTVIEGLLGLTQLLVDNPQAAADPAASAAGAFVAETFKEKIKNNASAYFSKKK